MSPAQPLVSRVASNRRRPRRLLDGVVRRLRRVAEDRDRRDDRTAYLCRICGTTYRTHRHVCSECDGGAVERMEPRSDRSCVVENPRRD